MSFIFGIMFWDIFGQKFVFVIYVIIRLSTLYTCMKRPQGTIAQNVRTVIWVVCRTLPSLPSLKLYMEQQRKMSHKLGPDQLKWNPIYFHQIFIQILINKFLKIGQFRTKPDLEQILSGLKTDDNYNNIL